MLEASFTVLLDDSCEEFVSVLDSTMVLPSAVCVLFDLLLEFEESTLT